MNRVLFVDDEPMILNSLKRGLIGENYEMMFAYSGQEALAVLESMPVSVLVTDMKMPGMTGLELLKIAKEQFPNTIRIVLSGFTHLPQVLVTVNQGDIFKFITKPWDLEGEFKAVIREAVDYFNFQEELRKGRDALQKKNATFQSILKTYDDKLMELKREIEVLTKVSEISYSVLEKEMTPADSAAESAVDYRETVETAGDIMNGIFGQMSVQSKRFTTKNIMEDLKKYHGEGLFLKHLELGLDTKFQTPLKGPYERILFIVKKVFEHLFEDAHGNHVSIILSGGPIEDSEQVELKVMIEANRSSYSSKGVFNTAWGILARYTQLLGGELGRKEVSGRTVFVLTLPCEI